MRAATQAATFILGAICCYFALSWALDAARVLTSPWIGLDDFAHAEIAHFLRQTFGLGADGVLLTTAALGAGKLAVAALFVVYLVERLRGDPWRGDDEHQMTLRAALAALIGLSTVLALPAILLGRDAPALAYSLQLLLAAAAGALSLIEQMPVGQAPVAVMEPVAEPVAAEPEYAQAA